MKLTAVVVFCSALPVLAQNPSLQQFLSNEAANRATIATHIGGMPLPKPQFGVVFDPLVGSLNCGWNQDNSILGAAPTRTGKCIFSVQRMENEIDQAAAMGASVIEVNGSTYVWTRYDPFAVMAQNTYAQLFDPSTSSITSAMVNSTSGTITGAAGTYCTASFNGGTGATGFVFLTASGTIAATSIIGIPFGGSGYSLSGTTTATLGNGTATCSGATANITPTIGGYIANKGYNLKVIYKFGLIGERFAPACAILASTASPFQSPLDINSCLTTTTFNSAANVCDGITCGIWLIYNGTQYSVVGYLAKRYGLYAELIPSEPDSVDTAMMFTNGVESAAVGSGGTGTATGAVGTWCTVMSGGFTGGSGSGAMAAIQLTQASSLTNATVVITSPGTGYTTAPTMANLSNGNGNMAYSYQNAMCGGTIMLSGVTTGTWSTGPSDYEALAQGAFGQIVAANASTIRGFVLDRYDYNATTDYLTTMINATNLQVVGLDSYNTDYLNNGSGDSGCPCQATSCRSACAGLGNILSIISEAQTHGFPVWISESGQAFWAPQGIPPTDGNAYEGSCNFDWWRYDYIRQTLASTTALFSSLGSQVVIFYPALFHSTYLAFGGINNGGDSISSTTYEQLAASASGNASAPTPPAQRTAPFYFYQTLFNWFGALQSGIPWPL